MADGVAISSPSSSSVRIGLAATNVKLATVAD